MKPNSRLLVLSAALAVLLSLGCQLFTLGPGDFTTLVFYFKLTQAALQGQPVNVHSTFYLNEVRLKKQFVRVSGAVQVPGGGNPAGKVAVKVVGEDASTGAVRHRFNVTLTIKADGTFSVTKRFKKDIPANTLQTFTIEALNGELPAGTMVGLCVDVAEKKGDLTNGSDCGTPVDTGGGDVWTVQVLDNRFDPKSITIQPGDTVRWELFGTDTSHTVTELDGIFDSGFTFTSQGARFERRFPRSEDGETFQYFCVTHGAGSKMEGSVLVGDDADPPRDIY